MISRIVRSTPAPPAAAFVKAVAIVATLAMVVVFYLPEARAQKPPKPLLKSEVIGLLEGGVPSTRVAEIARSHGIAFEMTRATEKQLRDAGADEDLVKTLRGLSSRSPAAPTRTPQPSVPAPPTGPPILLIEATPGGAQVYVDDEPVGTTSSQGRLRLSQLAPGTRQLRLSHAGYRDYDQRVELAAGQTTQVTANLEAAEPPGPTGTETPSGPAAGGPTTQLNPAAPPDLLPQTVSDVASFTVAHDHGSAGSDYCLGGLAIGNGMISYRSTNGVHSFDFPLSEVKEAKKNSVYLMALGAFHIRLKKGANYNFVQVNAAGQYLPPDAVLEAINRALGKH